MALYGINNIIGRINPETRAERRTEQEMENEKGILRKREVEGLQSGEDLKLQEVTDNNRKGYEVFDGEKSTEYQMHEDKIPGASDAIPSEDVGVAAVNKGAPITLSSHERDSESGTSLTTTKGSAKKKSVPKKQKAVDIYTLVPSLFHALRKGPTVSVGYPLDLQLGERGFLSQAADMKQSALEGCGRGRESVSHHLAIQKLIQTLVKRYHQNRNRSNHGRKVRNNKRGNWGSGAGGGLTMNGSKRRGKERKGEGWGDGKSDEDEGEDSNDAIPMTIDTPVTVKSVHLNFKISEDCHEYNCVRNAWLRAGFQRVKGTNWHAYWGKHLSEDGFRKLQPYQRVNHFPGTWCLGRKDRMVRFPFDHGI